MCWHPRPAQLQHGTDHVQNACMYVGSSLQTQRPTARHETNVRKCRRQRKCSGQKGQKGYVVIVCMQEGAALAQHACGASTAACAASYQCQIKDCQRLCQGAMPPAAYTASSQRGVVKLQKPIAMGCSVAVQWGRLLSVAQQQGHSRKCTPHYICHSTSMKSMRCTPR